MDSNADTMPHAVEFVNVSSTSKPIDVANYREKQPTTSKHQSHLWEEKEIARIDQQIEIFMKKLESEKLLIEDLNEQIRLNEAKVLGQKRRVGGNDASNKENKVMIEKQIRMLEDRLNKSLVTFNTKVGENKELRRKIDEMVG